MSITEKYMRGSVLIYESLLQTFVTDHDDAIYSVLAARFLTFLQRLCIWHINQNIGKKFVNTSRNVNYGSMNAHKARIDDSWDVFIIIRMIS